MPKAAGLTPKQQRFVDEYLLDLCAAKAAERAGYSPKTAGRIGPQLLAKSWVADAIAARKAERAERTGITADQVLRRLVAIATADVNELVELRREACAACWPQELKPTEPNELCSTCRGEGVTRPFFKDTRNLSESARALYAGVKVTRDGMEMKLNSQDRALELLGKHLGLFIERQETNLTVAGLNWQALLKPKDEPGAP